MTLTINSNISPLPFPYFLYIYYFLTLFILFLIIVWNQHYFVFVLGLQHRGNVFFSLIKASSMVLQRTSSHRMCLKHINIIQLNLDSHHFAYCLYSLFLFLIIRFLPMVGLGSVAPTWCQDPKHLHEALLWSLHPGHEGNTWLLSTPKSLCVSSASGLLSSLPSRMSLFVPVSKIPWDLFSLLINLGNCLSIFSPLWLPSLAHIVGKKTAPVYRVTKLRVCDIRSLWAFPWLGNQDSSHLALFHSAHSSRWKWLTSMF